MNLVAIYIEKKHIYYDTNGMVVIKFNNGAIYRKPKKKLDTYRGASVDAYTGEIIFSNGSEIRTVSTDESNRTVSSRRRQQINY